MLWAPLTPDLRHNLICYHVLMAHNKNNTVKKKGKGRILCNYVMSYPPPVFLEDSTDGILQTESRRFVGATLIATAFVGSVLLFLLCIRKGMQIIYFRVSQLLSIFSVNSSLLSGTRQFFATVYFSFFARLA